MTNRGPGGAQSNRWPGDRLGRPESGPGSVARAQPRIAAIIVDFGLCFAVYAAFFFGSSWASIAIFALEQLILVAFFGASIGHALLGLRLTTLDGRPLGPWRPAVRTALLCLLVPAAIWDADQRGLHDVFAGTVLVRR